MPVANTHYTAPRDIRHALKALFQDVSGYSLNQQGNFVAEQGTDVQLSDAVERLHRWLKAIFAVLTHHSRESADSLLLLLGAIQEAEHAVKKAREHGTSSDTIALWVLQTFSLAGLQSYTGINFGAEVAASYQHTEAPQYPAHGVHLPPPAHGVYLPPPQPSATPLQGLPYLRPELAPTVSSPGEHRLPPIELEFPRRTSQHSLAKEDQRLGSSMTARKAAIYGTTPEEWAARAAQRF